MIGQGTWGFGDNPRRHRAEVDALREGFAAGMTLVDTAEFYGAGESERVVGDATTDCRESVFLVTKIWPSHAEPRAMRDALFASLRRLRTDHVDACLLHWPTRAVPLPRIVEGLVALQASGLARHVGVSNFPHAMAAPTIAGLPAAAQAGGRSVFFHELPYSLSDRRVELTLLRQVQDAGGVLLAYSPLGHGRLLRRAGSDIAALKGIAAGRGITPAQAALAFLAAESGVVVLAKAADPRHVRENARSGDLSLDPEDLARLREAFPASRKDIGFGLPPNQAFFSLVYGGSRLLQGLHGRYGA